MAVMMAAGLAGWSIYSLQGPVVYNKTVSELEFCSSVQLNYPGAGGLQKYTIELSWSWRSTVVYNKIGFELKFCSSVQYNYPGAGGLKECKINPSWRWISAVMCD